MQNIRETKCELCGFRLTRYAHKGHIARATLEATAFQTKDVFGAMEKDSKVSLKELKVDGGMTANKLLLQFQADILGVPVVLPEVAETTALGAAFAAGLAVGVYSSLDDLKKATKVRSKTTPAMEQDESEKLVQRWKQAVER